MSLDVYLESPRESGPRAGSGIFVREGGGTREITREEWDAAFPGREPVTAEVDEPTNDVFWANITHTLSDMAEAAGLYLPLWRPEELGITKAGELIGVLRDGLASLEANPDRYRPYNPPNGWGDYEGLVRFVRKYLSACVDHPQASVRVSR